MALRCVLVDDNHHFLLTATKLLGRQDVHVVGVAHDASEGVERAAELRPDVVLIDINLGPENGFEVAKRLARLVNPPAVIMISSQSGADFIDLIGPSLAAGFIEKSALSGDAIRELL
ncbi:MAG TPA: response regulator transcription factor [Actinocatenispora sp.]